MNNLQTEYYETLKQQKQFVAIYLTNGVQLKGYIAGHEENVVFLENDASRQMVYKHSISTVRPMSDK